MSTLLFAQRMNERDGTEPEKPPASKMFVDAAAALVPAEVLAVHLAIITVNTAVTKGDQGEVVTKITEPEVLKWAFFALLGLAVVIYLVARIASGLFDKGDVLCALIPPAAFACWAMLQRPTAFDAVWPELTEGTRVTIAVIAVGVLGAIAALASYEAAGAAKKRPKAR
jgi:hypothetical protein